MTQVTSLSAPTLLLLVSTSEVVALDGQGVAWESGRVVLDDLEVVASSAGRIVGEGWGWGEHRTRVVLDAVTGEELSREQVEQG